MTLNGPATSQRDAVCVTNSLRFFLPLCLADRRKSMDPPSRSAGNICSSLRSSLGMSRPLDMAPSGACRHQWHGLRMAPLKLLFAPPWHWWRQAPEGAMSNGRDMPRSSLRSSQMTSAWPRGYYNIPREKALSRRTPRWGSEICQKEQIFDPQGTPSCELTLENQAQGSEPWGPPPPPWRAHELAMCVAAISILLARPWAHYHSGFPGVA